MKASDITVYLRSPGDGMGLLCEGKYIATYQSLEDCLNDLVYHFDVEELDKLFEQFRFSDKIKPPRRYRGIISEYFFPAELLNKYVFYADTLSEILEQFERLERRALKYPDHFLYAPQGCGIHLFDQKSKKYRFWIGGEMKSVPEVIAQAKREGKFVPNELMDELATVGSFDVFVSHKSEDILVAKRVYDAVLAQGKSAFLSEISLPALANADYAMEIDKALDSANNLVVVADSFEKVESGWVKYEWTSFANEKRSGRKTGNLLVVLTDNMAVSQLPFALRQCEVLKLEELDRLGDFIV